MRAKAAALPDAVVDATVTAAQAHPTLAADFVMTRIVVALLPLKLVSLFVSGTEAPMLPTPSESNLLGAGAYSKVYRISFNGAEVAAKVFTAYTGRGGCLQELICALASSPSTYILRLIDVVLIQQANSKPPGVLIYPLMDSTLRAWCDFDTKTQLLLP